MEKIYFFVILMLLQVGVFAQGGEQAKYQVQFKSGKYFPGKHYQMDSSSKRGNKGSRKADTKEYVLIQFFELPDKAAHEKVRAAGIELLEYIPNNAYLASVSAPVGDALLASLNVRSLEPVKAIYKIHPALVLPGLESWVEKESGMADVIVTPYKNYPAAKLSSAIEAVEGRILKGAGDGNMLEVRISIGQLTSLASLEGVSYVAPVAPPPVPLNYYSVTSSRVNVLRSGLTAARNLKGEGVTVAISDVFTGAKHADLQNRVANHTTYTSNDPHGDHTSGTVAGAGNLDPLQAGLAPKASLVYTDMVDNIYEAAAYYANQNVRISSNSYRGSLNGGEYDYNSRMIDEQTSGTGFPDLLHVFAAANEGSAFHTVADSWSASKNALVVGAVDHKNQIAYYSSRGPVMDGRLKPEVVAVGTNVSSTAPDNSYSLLSGTSMATPAVAGVAALLYERYKQMHGNVNPDAGLIKALICNTADDLGNPGPDFTYGFGQVNAAKAVESLEKNAWFKASVNAGDSTVHTINVPSGTAKLKVMLYWKDKEAAENSAVALVNDLNLRVKKGGTTILPWVLNPASGRENSHAVRGVDRLNNIEQVTIDNPSGSYSFTVNGSQMATGTQDYVVVYEMVAPEIAVTFPYAGESLVPGEAVFIRWDHAVAGPFSVEYSADNGSSWKTVATNINAKQNFVEWQVPNIVTGQLLVRVSNGTKRGVSAGVSSIIEVPKGFIVGDMGNGQKQARWKKAPGADAYEVYQLKPSDKEMQLVATVEDTSYLFKNINTNDHWFSVRAKTQQGVAGRRANASRAVQFRQPENPASVAAGLQYAYYEGSWDYMPDFDSFSPVKMGVSENIKHNEIKQRSDNYGIKYSGYIKVPEDGLYTFEVYARTEATFYVGNSLVAKHAIDRDGDDFGTGTIALKAGMHKISYHFYERDATNPGEFAYLLISGGSFSRREVLPAELFRATENQTPLVSIDSPADNTSLIAPASITIQASASDADGSVRKVEFFNGAGKLGEDSSAPYSFSWTNVGAGTYTIMAKATDDKGAVTRSAPVIVEVENAPSGNQVPEAFAGSDKTITLPKNSLNLYGQARDHDGRFVRFGWEKISGPSVTMSGQHTANMSLTNLVNGVYVFRFSATDNEGATGTDEMTLTVVGNAVPNQSPTVNAGPDKTVQLPLAELSFTATASDPDGTIVSYQWEKVSGPSVQMANAGSATLELTQLQEGTYQFKVSVTDNTGAVAADQLMLVVQRAPSGNQVPIANAGSDRTIFLPTSTLNISGQARDYDGRFVRFGWEKVSGPAVSMSGQYTANLRLSMLVEGVYIFRFSATDNDGATATDEMMLTVKAAAQSTALPANEGVVTVYPNTFYNYVNVNIQAEETSRYKIGVYDLLGRSIYHSQVLSQGNDEGLPHRIDLSDKNLEEGVYIVMVEGLEGNYRKITRVVKGK